MVSSAAAPEPSSGKATRTRAAILRAAEQHFAEHGFDRTRLEDVARDVGIRRASIVYHFKDKSALYEEVVRELFSGLAAVIEGALGSDHPPLERVEAAVSGWVDYVAKRPALARVMLREVADGLDGEHTVLARHIAPIAAEALSFLGEWKRSGLPRPTDVEPAHVASIITGATVFFVSAMPRLLWESGFDPLSHTELERYREQLLDLTWRMLRVEAPSRIDAHRRAAQRENSRGTA
jgi:TetR/AcrR family transcriptional regulator